MYRHPVAGVTRGHFFRSVHGWIARHRPRAWIVRYRRREDASRSTAGTGLPVTNELDARQGRMPLASRGARGGTFPVRFRDGIDRWSSKTRMTRYRLRQDAWPDIRRDRISRCTGPDAQQGCSATCARDCARWQLFRSFPQGIDHRTLRARIARYRLRRDAHRQLRERNSPLDWAGRPTGMYCRPRCAGVHVGGIFLGGALCRAQCCKCRRCRLRFG